MEDPLLHDEAVELIRSLIDQAVPMPAGDRLDALRPAGCCAKRNIYIGEEVGCGDRI